MKILLYQAKIKKNGLAQVHGGAIQKTFSDVEADKQEKLFSRVSEDIKKEDWRDLSLTKTTEKLKKKKISHNMKHGIVQEKLMKIFEV